jgi:DNA-directed RNA polymerase subunit RPC12/RpoP
VPFIVTVNTRLSKLEAKYKEVISCPRCRYVFRLGSRQKRKNYEDDKNVLDWKCWYCGFRYCFSLIGLDQHKREVRCIVLKSHPSKSFTDERVHAAFIWFRLDREIGELARQERKLSDSMARLVRVIYPWQNKGEPENVRN